MDPDTMRIVVIAIAAVGAVAWLAGASAMARATRDRRARAEEAAARFDVGDAEAAATVVGEAEVEGRPEEISEKLARALAREGMGPLGPVKIVACDSSELVFEPAGAGGAGPGSPPVGVHHGRFRFVAIGPRTRVEYAITAPSGRFLIAFGWLFVAMGLVALVAGCWLMFTYVIPNPNPSVRGQAFQMAQVVHLLWPPFLFAALSRQPARWISARADALVTNLPYA